MTPDELRQAEARYQRAFRLAEEAREARNATVRAALNDGWSHARIAEATGLTRSRVGQIAHTRPATETAPGPMAPLRRRPERHDYASGAEWQEALRRWKAATD